MNLHILRRIMPTPLQVKRIWEIIQIKVAYKNNTKNHMLQNQSKTVTGAIIALVSFALVNYAGFEAESAEKLIFHATEFIGIIIVYLDRVNKGDVNVIGRRKK